MKELNITIAILATMIITWGAIKQTRKTAKHEGVMIGLQQCKEMIQQAKEETHNMGDQYTNLIHPSPVYTSRDLPPTGPNNTAVWTPNCSSSSASITTYYNGNNTPGITHVRFYVENNATDQGEEIGGACGTHIHPKSAYNTYSLIGNAISDAGQGPCIPVTYTSQNLWCTHQFDYNQIRIWASHSTNNQASWSSDTELNCSNCTLSN